MFQCAEIVTVYIDGVTRPSTGHSVSGSWNTNIAMYSFNAATTELLSI